MLAGFSCFLEHILTKQMKPDLKGSYCPLRALLGKTGRQQVKMIQLIFITALILQQEEEQESLLLINRVLHKNQKQM